MSSDSGAGTPSSILARERIIISKISKIINLRAPWFIAKFLNQQPDL